MIFNQINQNKGKVVNALGGRLINYEQSGPKVYVGIDGSKTTYITCTYTFDNGTTLSQNDTASD